MSDQVPSSRAFVLMFPYPVAHLSWVAPTLRRCLDMLDPSRLQIDLFVSRDAPRPPRRSRRQQSSSHFQQPYPSTADDFAPPQAPFARQARPQSSQSLDSDMSDFSDAEDDAGASSTAPSNVYTQNPEYEEQIDSVTDLVLFDGEDDERTAGEVEMSSKVRSAGKIRRALSRKKTKRAQGGNNLGARPQLASTQSDLSTFGSEQDVGYSSLSGAAGARHPSPYNRADSSFAQTGSFADLNFAGADDHQSEIQSLAGSSRHLVGSGGGKRSSGGEDVKNEEFDFLDVTEEDQEDLDVVAELAKPGYPKLKEIMGEEIDRSTGKTMVACEFLDGRSSCSASNLLRILRRLWTKRPQHPHSPSRLGPYRPSQGCQGRSSWSGFPHVRRRSQRCSLLPSLTSTARHQQLRGLFVLGALPHCT